VGFGPWESGAYNMVGAWNSEGGDRRFLFLQPGEAQQDYLLQVYSKEPFVFLGGWFLRRADRTTGEVCFSVLHRAAPHEPLGQTWCARQSRQLPERNDCMDFGPHETLCKDHTSVIEDV